MRAYVREKPCGNDAIEPIERRHCPQPRRGQQNLIAKPDIPIQRLKHTIARL